MIYVLIVLLVILIIPIKVVISKDDKESNIDLYFTRIFDIHLDLDEFLRKFVGPIIDGAENSIDKIKDTYNSIKTADTLITTFTRTLKVRKLTVIIKTKKSDLIMKTWEYVIIWTLFSFLQNYAHKYFKKINDEYYNYTNSEELKINFELIFSFRLIYILYALIRNIKDLPKIYRTIKKGKKVYGQTSNS